MIGRGRMRAVDGDNVHTRQHLVEAVPIGGLEPLLDVRRDAAAIVIMDLKAEGLGAPCHGLADAPHADNAEPLAVDSVPEHPGRRPAVPVVGAGLEHRRALGETPRHGKDQRHGHVGRVLGQDARRVGHDDRAVPRRVEVDIVDAGAELGDQLEVGTGLAQHRPVDAVGDRRHEHVGRFHRLDELVPRKRPVLDVEPRVEQLSQPCFHDLGELTRDDNERSVRSHNSSCQEPSGRAEAPLGDCRMLDLRAFSNRRGFTR